MSQFTLNNSEIKDLITKWSDSTPHHGHKNLGDNINIQSIRNILVHRMLVYSQSVSRYINMTTKPLNGESYDNNNYLKEEDIKCWGYSYTPPTAYTNEGSYFIIDKSKHSITCYSCKGKGVVKCSKCNNGEIRCSSCNGTGNRKTTTSCSSCSGSGSITTYRQVCKIEGYRSDHTPIQKYENVQESKRCGSCGGTGKRESTIYGGCYTCGGSGRVTCPTCNGTALVRCKTCNGNGSLLKFAELHTKHSYHKDDTILSSNMSNAELKIMLKEVPLSDYKRDKVVKSTDGQVKSVDFSTPLQKNTAISMLNKAARAVQPNGRILFEEAQLKTVELLAIYYSYANANYVIYIVNNNNRTIIADESPIKGSYKELVTQAVESANNENFNQALNIIKKCQDFPQTDKQDKDFENSIYIGMEVEVSFGIKLGVYIFSLLFLPQILLYYIEHNYVLSYVSFINKPHNFAYGATWINAIITMFVAIWLSKKAEDLPLTFAKWLPNKTSRIITGIVLSTVVMLGATAIVALLNMIGILPILDYAFNFCLTAAITIIAFIVMGVISIFN